MTSPRISVLIRSMDRPTLARALQSIAIQDAALDIEVVVVAACGSSHRALPERCGPHALRLVVQDERLSRADAANRALDSARGD